MKQCLNKINLKINGGIKISIINGKQFLALRTIEINFKIFGRFNSYSIFSN